MANRSAASASRIAVSLESNSDVQPELTSTLDPLKESADSGTTRCDPFEPVKLIGDGPPTTSPVVIATLRSRDLVRWNQCSRSGRHHRVTIASRRPRFSTDPGKSDPIDAISIARPYRGEGDLPVACRRETSWKLTQLVDRREDLVGPNRVIVGETETREPGRPANTKRANSGSQAFTGRRFE